MIQMFSLAYWRSVRRSPICKWGGLLLHRARGLAAARRQQQLWRCAASRLCCVILASVFGYFPTALRSLSARAALFLAWRQRDSRLSSAVHILWSRCGTLFSGIHSAAPGL